MAEVSERLDALDDQATRIEKKVQLLAERQSRRAAEESPAEYVERFLDEMLVDPNDHPALLAELVRAARERLPFDEAVAVLGSLIDHLNAAAAAGSDR